MSLGLRGDFVVLLWSPIGETGRDTVKTSLAKNQKGSKSFQEMIYPLRHYPESVEGD